MKIHKMEDKPMVIHTKKKAKIHRVEKSGKRGRRKVSARKSTPKVKKTVRMKKSGKLRPKMQPLRNIGTKEKMADAKVVSHNTPKKAEVTHEKQLNAGMIKSEAKKLASTRHSSGIKELGMAGAKTATDQLEGGEELQQAAMVAYELSRPVYGTVEKSSDFMKQELLAQRKRRLKVVDTPKTSVKRTTIGKMVTTPKTTVPNRETCGG